MASQLRVCAVLLLACGVLASAQRLPSEPPRQFGSSITPAYEGWFDNPDGSHSFLVGYLNRNSTQALDIPIGPNNSIEPGGPDMGQPTHFLPGRQFGMFIITVPKEFTPQQRLTWTIVANGQPMSIPLRMNVDYKVSPFLAANDKNTPPLLRFDEKGPTAQGPIAKAFTRSATVSAPLPLTVWGTEDEKYSSGTNAPLKKPPPAITLNWSKYRGPGEVTFDKPSAPMEKLPGSGTPFSGKGVATATFSAPGEYILHLTANDSSGEGGGGEVCCWTTVVLKVSVTP